MTTVHASNGPPMAWSTNRFNQCLKPVLPARRNTSAGRCIPLRRYSGQMSAKECRSLECARDLLYQQRVSIKVFTGNRWPFNRSVKDITDRLSRYDPRMKPPESKSLFPQFEMTQSATRQTHTAQDVQDIVDRLSTYDPEKIPESKGYKINLEIPIIYKKKYTKREIEDIVDRLMDYDPERFPAESKGVSPVVVHELPRETLSGPRKSTAKEVQDLVDRLCQKDPEKWPSYKRNQIENAFNTVLCNSVAQRPILS